MSTKGKKVLVGLSILLIIIGVVVLGKYLTIEYEYYQKVISYIDESMSPFIYIALMLFMPLIGFPISVFLIIGGIKFGIFHGILLWLLVLPAHALIGFYVARPLRNFLIRIFRDKLDYRIPEVPENNTAMFSFVFLAIPGIPYAVKNYMLPLAGVPFRYCVFMNAIIQSVQGIPFIVLGKSVADMDMTLFYVAILFLLMVFIMLRYLKKWYEDKIGGLR